MIKCCHLKVILLIVPIAVTNCRWKC